MECRLLEEAIVHVLYVSLLDWLAVGISGLGDFLQWSSSLLYTPF